MDEIKAALAKNLSRLMEMSADLKSQTALAKRSKVAQTTIGNYLKPESYIGAPNLEKVAQLAKAFGLEAWQLIHPTMGDSGFTRRELELYKRFREDMMKARGEHQ